MGVYKVKGERRKDGTQRSAWYIDLYADGRRIRKAVGSKRDAPFPF